MTHGIRPTQTRRVWRYPAGEDGWRRDTSTTIVNKTTYGEGDPHSWNAGRHIPEAGPSATVDSSEANGVTVAMARAQ